MAELCFCDICMVADVEGDTRCSPKLKRILVTVLDQPDATGSPNLWRTTIQGSRILPVSFFGGTPTIGETYIGHLMCSSGEYVSFLPSAEGSFWVLYSDEEIYLVELPSTATLKGNWDTLSENGVFIAMGIEQADKLVIPTTSEEVFYTADAADSWASVQSLDRDTSDVRFDHTTEDTGWFVEKINILLDSSEETTLANAIGSLSLGNHDPITVHNNYSSFNAQIQPIKVYQTTDGGATWTPTTLTYLGSHAPSRILGSPFITQFMESVLNGDCNWDTFTDICTWETFGDVPTAASFPCMAGSITSIVFAGNPRDLAVNRDNAGDVKQYAICNATDAVDPDNLTFYPPEPSTPLIAPFHNGTGYYVCLPVSYTNPTFTGSFLTTDYITPFLNHPSPSLTSTNTTLIFDHTAQVLELEPTDLTNGGFERIDTDIQVDKTDTNIIYGISSSDEVYRISFSGGTATEITPVDNNDIYNLSESWVTGS